MLAYIPCPADFLARVTELSHDLWFMRWEDWSVRTPWNIQWGADTWYRTRDPYRIFWKSGTNIDWNRLQLEHHLQADPYEQVRSDPLVLETLKRQKSDRDDLYVRRNAHECIRTMQRTAQIKSELLAVYPRMQSILRCHTIKEELYQIVYHPRRIERLLEIGGWEALENFAGL